MNQPLSSPKERQSRLLTKLGKVLLLCVGLVAIPCYSVFFFNAYGPSSSPSSSFTTVDLSDVNSSGGRGKIYIFKSPESAADRGGGTGGNGDSDVGGSSGNYSERKKLNIDRNAEGSTFLTMYGAHRVQSSLGNLPKWLQDYFSWWRQKQGDNDIKYVVLSCLQADQCGGLSDRFRSLPSILHLGSLTQRAVCIYWERPHPLEAFLQPPEGGVDWRCPDYIKDDLKKAHNHISQYVDPYISLGISKRPPRSSNDGSYCPDSMTLKECAEKEIKYLQSQNDPYVIVHLITSIDRVNNYNYLFQAHSYRDTMPSILKWQHVDLTGDIFRVMFEPVDSLARRVNATMSHLGLVEDEYTSVHIRARYPSKRMVKYLGNRKAKKYDKKGIGKFEGDLKEHLLQLAQNAFQCDSLLKKAYQESPFHHGTVSNVKVKADGPIYLSSDFNDFTHHLTANGVKIQGRNDPIMPISLQRKELITHFDQQTQDDAEGYFPTMEDLLIMGGSQCVTHGIGSFGAFGAALAGNRCRAIHRAWHGEPELCPNDLVMRKATNITDEYLLLGETGNEGDGKLVY